MKYRSTFFLFVFLLANPGSDAQNTTEITLYHGLDAHSVAVIPNTRPPLVRFNDVLAALSIPFPEDVFGVLKLEVNHRPLEVDRARQRARYKQKSVAFPMRGLEGQLFVRVDALSAVFSELLGRQMIYEPTSRSMHVPKSEHLKITVRTRKVADGFRLILIYSRGIKPPKVTRAGRSLIVKIGEGPILWDRSGFEPNDAVTGIEIFEGLPDNSTEILFKIGPKADQYQVEPFNAKNPRTIVKISGDFSQESAAAPEGSGGDLASGLSLIVLDPGHGGVDQGAVGPTGLREKDITLELALMLKTLLEREYGYQVAMTRKDDSFLSLKSRTGIANNLKADLLVSIHVNAIRFPNARGSETYFLSLDEDSPFDLSHYEEFKERENGTEAETLDDDLSLILWDMAQTKHTEDSFRVAKYIQRELNDLAGIQSRGVKQAPLKVLKGATMPAVLIETAFITNQQEEEKLKSQLFKDRIVRAIARAIRQYDEDIKKRSQGQAPVTPEEGR